MGYSALEAFGEHTPLPESLTKRRAPSRATPSVDSPASAPLFALAGILLIGAVFQSSIGIGPRQARTAPAESLAARIGALEGSMMNSVPAEPPAEPPAAAVVELPAAAAALPEPPVADAPAGTADSLMGSFANAEPKAPSILNNGGFSLWSKAHNDRAGSGVATNCPYALKNALAAGMAHYTSSGAGYTSSGAGYRSSGAAYASSGAGYASSGAGYGSSGAAYASSGAGYTSSGAGYRSSGAGYRTSSAGPAGPAAPCNCGK